jgi:hypothetical protein
MATKRLENMSVAELRTRHKQVTGRSTKESNKKKLIEAIEQHARLERRVEIARTAGQKKRGPSRTVAESAAAGSDAPNGDGATVEPKKRGKWSTMTTDELRCLYEQKIGRPTSSDDRGYLIWKIREAEKGHIKTGPVQRPKLSDEPTTPITLRLPTSLTEKMDVVWRRLGHRSRLHLIELSIGHGLKKIGEAELGAEFERRRSQTARAGEEA